MGTMVDPNVKRISWVARKFMLVGLGFLAVGLLVSSLLPTSPRTPAEAPIVFGVLALIGAIFVCVRVGVVIDRQESSITTWWGLLVPFYKTVHPFSPAHVVTISREERLAPKRRYDVFPVRLEGAGTDAVTIHEPLDHDNARRLAEDVAKFVHLGIRDRSSGKEVAREAGALDRSLQQRLKRPASSKPLPVQPPRARAIINYGGTRAPTTIEIPPVGRRVLLREFLRMVVLACFGGLFFELVTYNESDAAVGVATLVGFLFFWVIFLPLLIRSAILRERLIVSPDDFIVTQRDLFGTKTTRLSSGEIEEVEVTKAKRGMSYGFAVIGGGNLRVVIRSDRGSIELGAALLKPKELKWLSEVLIHILTSYEYRERNQ